MRKLIIKICMIPFLALSTDNIESGRIEIWGNQGNVNGILDQNSPQAELIKSSLNPHAPVIHHIPNRENHLIGFNCNHHPQTFEYMIAEGGSMQLTNLELNVETLKQCETLIYAALAAKEDRPVTIYLEKQKNRFPNVSVMAIKYRDKIIYPPNVTPEIELKVLLDDMMQVQSDIKRSGEPPCIPCQQ